MAIPLLSNTCKKGCTDPKALNYDSSIKSSNSKMSYCQYPNTVNATTLDCQAFSTPNTTYQLQDLGFEIDYIVDCKMPVHCDLEIMPGVAIAFKTNAGLNVFSDGSINAVGTASSPILFTIANNAEDHWAGIFIDSDDTKNKFDYCSVIYAGGDSFNSNNDKGAFILYGAAKAQISNTTISLSKSYGINANYSGGSFVFNNNTIKSCTNLMFIAAEYGSSISGGTFTDNTTNVIYINTYGGQADITTSQTWSNLNVPYRVKSGASIQSKADWTIAPGVVMEFEPGSGIAVTNGNSLKAVGNASQKIIFKGVNSGQGAWKNIYFNSTNSLNEMAFAEVNGGGEDPTTTKGSVLTDINARLSIHDVLFKDNLACGMYIKISGTTPNPNYSSSNLTFSNNTCDETSGN